MLRVKAVTPLHLDSDEVVRRQARYDRLAGPSIRVDLVNLGPEAPLRLDSAEDIARSEELVREEALRADPDHYDLVLPDCVLDPAVGAADGAPVPLVGILQLAGTHLAALGRPFAAVTRNRAIGEELRRRAGDFGFAAQLESVEVLDVDFCLVSDTAGWAEAMAPLGSRLTERGVPTLFNGCSAVEIPDDRLGAVLVVDPTRLAMRLLAVAHETGVVGSPDHVAAR